MGVGYLFSKLLFVLQLFVTRTAPNIYAFPYKVNDVNINQTQFSNLRVSFKYGNW